MTTDQHQRLIQKLAYGPDALLRKHFQEHKYVDDVYPVLLGGVSHVRCVEKLASMFSMTTSDIDIKFVIPKKESPALIQKADQMRKDFLEGIMYDRKIQKILSHEFDQAYLILSPMDTTMHGKRQVIYVQYKDEPKRITLIDTAIVSEKSFPFFRHYKNFFFHQTQTEDSYKPIPFVWKNDIPFATCNWTYYDTIRMLNTSRIDFFKSPNKFAYKKYIKYILKFISLYFIINKVQKINESDLIKELYSVFVLLQSGKHVKDFITIETILQKTNLNVLIKKYLAIPEMKLIEKEIINYILKSVLAIHMKKHETKNYYPLIIGGVNLTRCFKKVDASRLSIIKDIDMPFIVTEPKYMKDAEGTRDRMLEDIVGDPKLSAYLNLFGGKEQLQINIILEKYTDTEGSFKSFVDRLKFNNIDIEIKDLNQNIVYRNSIIDSTVLQQSSSGKNEWHGYDKYIRTQLQDPIPYIKTRGVNYATCGYTEFDLMKMLIIYKQEFEKSQIPSTIEKFFKYMIKYALFCNRLDMARTYKLFLKRVIFLDKSTSVCNAKEKALVLSWYENLKQNTPFGKLEGRIAAML